MRNSHNVAFVWCIFHIGLSLGVLMLILAGISDKETNAVFWVVNLISIALYCFALNMNSVAMICILAFSILSIIGRFGTIGDEAVSDTVIGLGTSTFLAFLDWFIFFILKSKGKTAFQLAKDKQSGNNDAQNSSENTSITKKCPYCAEEIKKEAIVCKFCKRDLV